LGIKKELCKSGTCKHNCIYCYMLRNYESQWIWIWWS
jgi:pyruvate formate-lyase activating enzyme-like uncharacterized protein